MERLQLIRAAYLACAPPDSKVSTSPQGVALAFAGVEHELRRQLSNTYFQQFHLLLANSGTTRVLFLDAPAHASHVDSCAVFQTKACKDVLEQNVQNRIQEMKDEGQPFVIVMNIQDDYLVLYRRQLMAYIQQLKHWPLELVPGKIIRLMMKMMPSPGPMRCNWFLKMSLAGFFNTVITARSEACANCGSSGDGVELRTCAQCMQVKYCDAACQRAHWREEHEEMCQLFQQMQSQTQTVSASISTCAEFAAFMQAHRIPLLGE